jgi:Tfp pilus assembly protein PilX
LKKNKIYLFISIILLILIYSCSDNNSNPASSNTTSYYNVQELFSETWSSGEMSSMAYDPAGDNLYYMKSTNSGPNQVHRYNFATGKIDTVYSYLSQWDYGMRILNGDVYVIRSYDNSILRLKISSADTLLKLNTYPDSLGQNSALDEIVDAALANGNLYFVCGNMLTSMQNNGVQYLQGPNFTTVSQLISSSTANWPDSPYVYTRSILSVGSGSSTKFAITTGSNGNIELWDATGNFIKADSGYGEAYLQKDSQNRIYAITGFGNNTKLTRWSASLDEKKEFTLKFSQYGGGNGVRYILRDSGKDIEVIMIQFRSRNPIFYKTTIPG